MNKNNLRYVVIPEWIYDLDDGNLTMTEIICASVIYGFSQDGESKFQGSASYLMKWCHLKSRTKIFEALKNLTDKGIILKHTKEINGVRLNDYSFNLELKNTPRSESEYPIQKVNTPYSQCEHHNIEDNITPYTSKDVYPPKGESLPKRTVFKVPTVEELEAYGKSKGFTKTDYLDFWEFYENKGWKIGKEKMKSWQLALNRWERNQQSRGSNGTSKGYFSKDTNKSRKGCNDPRDYEDFGIEYL